MNKVRVKRSSVPNRLPTTEQVIAGELAVNTADSKFFFGTGTAIVEVLNKDGVLPLLVGRVTSGILTTTVSGPQVLDSITIAEARSIEYLVQGMSGTQYQVTKLLLIHDNLVPALLEYGSVETNGAVFSLDAQIVSGSISLIINPVNNIGVYKFIRSSID